MDSILRSLGPGVTKTQIMYKAYLSFSQLKEYLSILQENGLLSYEPGSNLYKLTEKGLRFMNAFDEIQQLVSNKEEHELVEGAADATQLKKREAFNF